MAAAARLRLPPVASRPTRLQRLPPRHLRRAGARAAAGGSKNKPLVDVARRHLRRAGARAAAGGSKNQSPLVDVARRFWQPTGRAPKPAPPSPHIGQGAAAYLAAAALAAPALYAELQPDAVVAAFGLASAPLEACATLNEVQYWVNVTAAANFSLLAAGVALALAPSGDDSGLSAREASQLALGLVLFGAANTTAAAVAAARGADPAACALFAAACAPALLLGGGAASSGGPAPGEGGDVDVLQVAFNDARALTKLTDNRGYLELYYKGSFFLTLVVGGAFAFSPLSPLSLVNAADPASNLLQRTFGLGACFMLAPAQAVLARAAAEADGRGMSRPANRLLNLAIALSIAGIDTATVLSNDGAQRVLGGETTQAYEAAAASGALDAASGGLANYVAALLTSASICGVYLYQGLAAKGGAGDAGRA